MDILRQAIEDYTQALEILKSPKYRFKPYFNRGNAYREVGKLSESVADLQAAVDLEPTNPSAQNNLGLSLFEAGDHREAVARFAAAIELDPSVAM